MFVNSTNRHFLRPALSVLWIALLVFSSCKDEEETYLELNEADDCVLVDVLEEGAVVDDDDDDSAGDDDSADDPGSDNEVWTDLTCCGGGTVIGQAVIKPAAAAVGTNRYAAVQIDQEAFEDTGSALSTVVRVTVQFDPHDVGDDEVELQQNGLEQTLWDNWLGNGDLGGVPRQDTLCFHLWGEDESEE